MNHDHCHCLNYNEATCPKTCFRAKLTKEYKERCIDFEGIPVTWANLRDNTLCPLNKSKRTNGDRIRTMTDAELAEYMAEKATAPSCTGKCHKDYEVYGELRTFCCDCWLDWLKKEVQE